MADPPPEDDLHSTAERLEQRLAEAGAPGASPFTPQAYDLLKRRVAEYIDDLIDESIRVARRRPASDVVSTADVNRASEHLGSRPRGRRGQITPESAWLTFCIGAVGAAMSVFGFVRD